LKALKKKGMCTDVVQTEEKEQEEQEEQEDRRG
jgi:hypothetical protein